MLGAGVCGGFAGESGADGGDALAQIERVVALSKELTDKRKAMAVEHGENKRDRVAKLQQQQDAPDVDIQKLDEIDALSAAEADKCSRMKRLVGQKGRVIASLQRRMDVRAAGLERHTRSAPCFHSYSHTPSAPCFPSQAPALMRH